MASGSRKIETGLPISGVSTGPEASGATVCPPMNPEKRTLLQVRVEDVVESEEIFSTLMGEDVENRRKFIEDNALDVKNLDV